MLATFTAIEQRRSPGLRLYRVSMYSRVPSHFVRYQSICFLAALALHLREGSPLKDTLTRLGEAHHKFDQSRYPHPLPTEYLHVDSHSGCGRSYPTKLALIHASTSASHARSLSSQRAIAPRYSVLSILISKPAAKESVST